MNAPETSISETTPSGSASPIASEVTASSSASPSASAAASTKASPQQARVILQAMKTYVLIVADNGSNWYVSGTPDSRWSDEQLNTLKRVPGSAFDVVALGAVTSG